MTYGYTSATYSGRMPCIEVADSIVQTGRETLEKVRSSAESADGFTSSSNDSRRKSLYILALIGALKWFTGTPIRSSSPFPAGRGIRRSRSAMILPIRSPP